MNLGKALGNVAATVSRHSPAILTGVGIAGFVTTVVMAFRAGPTASEAHNWYSATRGRIREDSGYSEEEAKELVVDSYKEEAKELAPVMLPVVLAGGASIACVLVANKIHADRHAAIVAAYSISERTLSTYQQKVIEKLGEDVHSDILTDTTKEIVQSTVPDGYDKDSEIVPMGKVRVYDNVTGRYFYSNRETILEAESAINKRLLNETRVPLQEFYYELGLEERFVLGDCMGWDMTSYYSNNALDIFFTPMLDDEKNPCLAINYHVIIFERTA
jgi:hypothetical protein